MEEEKVELEKVSPPDEAALLRPGYPRMSAYPTSYGYGYGYNNANDRINLRELWRLIRKRKWIVLTTVLIVTTVVTIEMYRTRSIYQASAVIEIGRDNTLVKSGDLVVQDETDLWYPEMVMKTKILVLKSRPLLEDVVVKLDLPQNPKFFDVEKGNSLLNALKNITEDEQQNESQPADPALESLAALKDSRELRSLEESEKLEPYVEVLDSNLTAERLRDTRALRVSFTHTDPAIAAMVVNGVADTFVNKNYQNITKKFTDASDWLERSTRELKAKVEQSEQALADYTRDHKIFSIDGKETLTTDKLSRLHDQALRAETDRMLKQSLYEEVRAGHVERVPEGFADPKTTELRKKLNDLEVMASQLNVKYGPNNPKVVEVRQQMETIQSQIDANRKSLEEKLQADYGRAVRDEQSLKSALDRAKSEAVDQNQAAIKYNMLKQEVDTAKSLYTDFLQKTNQAKVDVAQQSNNMRIIETAKIPKMPIGPRRFRSIILGFLLSLIAGVGLVYFIEYLDNTIKTIDDVGRYTQLPALGIIPPVGASKSWKRLTKSRRRTPISAGLENKSQLVALDTRSSAAEAYRVVRTSVLLSAAGNPPKLMLVTSGQPSEGKTTTVTNTAISLAQLGASVLVIDCDLRKPAVHKVFGIDPSLGLSTYLSRDVEVDDLIKPLQIPNLSVLPCGPIPPNPAELISSDRMKFLLKNLSERYDHILIDSPPLINVTDAVILSTMVDGVIMVVHGGKSSRDIVRQARQEILNVGGKIFGVVLNNVDLSREGYNDYYYYRYYGAYQQEEED